MSDQDNGQVTTLQRPMSDDPEAWKTYWKAQGWPWRTEPEIDAERQKYLTGRRAIVPDTEQGIYPFKDIKLSRADVEWLLVTHENGRGPVDWSDEKDKPILERRTGLDLRGADMRQVDLNSLPLANLLGGPTLLQMADGAPEQSEIAAVHLEEAKLNEAHLEGAILYRAHMEKADGLRLHLEGAKLSEAHLEGAMLSFAQFQEAHIGETDLLFGLDPTDRRIVFGGAHLEGARLYDTHLEKAYCSSAYFEGANLIDAHLEGAYLASAHLEGTILLRTHLEKTKLYGAHLEGAILRETHLEGADLFNAHLEGKRVRADDLERIRKWEKESFIDGEIFSFPETLPPTNLELVFFDSATNLKGVTLGNRDYGFVRLADTRWSDVNLTVIDWLQINILGDETKARQKKEQDGKIKEEIVRLNEFLSAIRANRQLATALQSQGLNEDASRFAYRAQLCQRVVLRRQKKFGSYLFSLFLDLLAGYGYRPGRSVLWYLATILVFALAYHLLGGLTLFPPDAFVFSVMSFHGRGFFPALSQETNLHNPLVMLAAAEAIIGLLIEISFIATFTQRFFGR